MRKKGDPAVMGSRPGRGTERTARLPVAHCAVNPRPPAAWKVGPGDIRVQVHQADLAGKLLRIRAGCLVGRSVAGPYTRIFAFSRSLVWAEGWIRRHTCTNGAFSGREGSESDFDSAGGSTPQGGQP